ncbi:hypothetical protein RBH20_19500 [Haloarcula sp. H-GB4]|uniref:hypothetical protein n=1 Tax=Haloarcula sp. H-GB4 TaxID=3069755 RepID=UPI0027B74438|nr:hypothetical protein [Haloarcula sp. H-GB4]MDQ2074718.1 hypothetical protein [Haloarcula sp. H-GB4]
MTRAEELLFAHHGSHKEDNATKNLCWLLNKLPWDISRKMLETLVDPVDHDINLQTIDPSSVTVKAQENTAVSAERSDDAALIGLATQGHDYDKPDVTELDPSQPPKEPRRLDITIEINDELVVGVEAKEGSTFNQSQLQDHARELEASEFDLVTWEALSQQIGALLNTPVDEIGKTEISGEEISGETVRLLLSEYRKLLKNELVVSWEQIGTSSYTAGENSIRLKKDVEIPHKAIEPYEETERVPVAVVFQSVYEEGSKNGGRLFFSPEEWRQLLSSMDECYVKAFEKGELACIADDYESGRGQITVAEITNSAGDKKYIRYGDRGKKNNEPYLHLNKSTARGGNIQDIPMYDENEFAEMFGPESSVTKLFTDPERVFESSK